MKDNAQFFLGIGGISRAGKSTLARRIHDHLTDHQVTSFVVSMDEYVLPEDQLSRIRDRVDWEDPNSVDWEQLLTTLQKSTEKVIILEGIFVFDNRLQNSFDARILLDIDRRVFRRRRSDDPRWGPEPAWYVDHVWDSNNKLNLPRQDAVIIDGTLPADLGVLIRKTKLGSFLNHRI